MATNTTVEIEAEHEPTPEARQILKEIQNGDRRLLKDADDVSEYQDGTPIPVIEVVHNCGENSVRIMFDPYNTIASLKNGHLDEVPDKDKLPPQGPTANGIESTTDETVVGGE
jgi:hypothetical protein